MFKRNHALKLRREQEPQSLPVHSLEKQRWVQEEEKLRNERREVEPMHEKIQRLSPGFNKKFYL